MTLLLPGPLEAATRPGTEIVNVARAELQLPNGIPLAGESNEVVLTTLPEPTPARLEFLRFAEGWTQAESLAYAQTGYSESGGAEGPFRDFSPGPPVAGASALPEGEPVPAVVTGLFHQADLLFVRLRDGDQNLSWTAVDTIVLEVTCSETGDREWLLLREDGPDSGVFTGYLPTYSGAAGTAGDGRLAILDECLIDGRYVDPNDPADVATASGLFDPIGRIFDSQTGLPVDGATVTLLDAETGEPARVFGLDGTSAYPAQVVSGAEAEDESGARYDFGPGVYRFPLVQPGRYRVEVIPPEGYAFASGAAIADLQDLPAAPYALDAEGSYGRAFRIQPVPIFRLDIPVDPVSSNLWLRKAAGKTEAAVGDFVPYRLTVENADRGHATRGGVVVTDTLPRGFHYRPGSARLEGEPLEPEVGADGRTLVFHLDDLAAGESRELRYVAEVGAGSRPGRAVNRAVARAGSLVSGPAEAVVEIRDPFFRDVVFITGRVITDACGEIPEDERRGEPGVRLYTEDGTYVVTDAEGRFHFEGLRPGTHVLQIDQLTVPEGYRVVACDPDTRLAGRADSRFVDLQGGTLWQTDFHLAPVPPPRGEVAVNLEVAVEEDRLAYRVGLQTSVVPIVNPRLSVVLPPGHEILPGSAALDDVTLEAPQQTGQVVTFRLPDPAAADWQGTVFFAARPTGEAPPGERGSKALLTFDTAAGRNQRTPVAETTPGDGPAPTAAPEETRPATAAKAAPGASVRMKTKAGTAGSSGPPPAPEATIASRAPSDFDPAWLAGDELGATWLWPPRDWNPPIASLKMVARHPLAGQVTLLRNGEPVSPLCFDGSRKNAEQGVAVSRWRAIDLSEGDNHFELLVRDGSGQVLTRLERTIHYSGPPVAAVLVPERSTLEVDGRTPPVIALRLLDKQGHPVRSGVVGTFAVEPPHRAWEDRQLARQEELLGADATLAPRYEVAEDGLAYLRLDPQSPVGEAVIRLPLEDREEEYRVWLEPVGRDWVLVGLAEGTTGYRTVSEHAEELPGDVDENFYRDGRLAFFAKGRIRGEWLLTLAYDSERPDRRGEELYRTIDPDAYYPLYGDATSQGYEAPSAEKLFVKLERRQFYALFGDYDTGLTVTDLSRYNRSLTGFKSQTETEGYSLNIFASDSGQAFVKDELRGDGTSGLYRLSRSDIVRNSEKVFIEVRDRLRSEVVLSSTPLARHTGYNIDYVDGTLFFKEPIPSQDEDFNPVYIVVDYETAAGDGGWSFGGRGALRFFQRRLEVGASHVHEDRGQEDGELYGVDLTARLTPNLTLHAEAAASENDDVDGRSEGSAAVAELEHRSENLTGLLYYREQEAGFGLGQQRGTESGTRKVGVDADYRLGARWHLEGAAFRQDNLDEDARRDVVAAGVRYSRERYHLDAGLRQATDTFEDGTEQRSNQVTLGGDWQSTERLLLRARHEQALGSKDDNPDFPTRTLVGADYRLNPAVGLFAEHELARGESLRSNATRAGFRLTPWNGGQLNSTLQQETLEDRSRLFALFGLAQTWQLSEHWSLDGSLDRSHTVRNDSYRDFDADVPPAVGSGEDFTAVSLGAGYHEDEWAWTGRVEWRTGENEDRWSLTSGIYGQVRRDLGLSSRFQGFYRDADEGEEDISADLSFGVAWRPLARRLVLLDRLDLLADREEGPEGSLRSYRAVNNLNLNWRCNRRTQVSFQYGAKYVVETFDGDRYSAFTDLFGLEGRYDLNERWDLGLRGSLLHSWERDQADYSAGASVGYLVVTNAWLSLGYNVSGFTDPDFSAADYTAQGPYLKFRVKFDQHSAADLRQWLKNL